MPTLSVTSTKGIGTKVEEALEMDSWRGDSCWDSVRADAKARMQRKVARSKSRDKSLWYEKSVGFIVSGGGQSSSEIRSGLAG